MINTVFRNLVSNANKYTNAGGTIKVDAKQLKGDVEVDVADEGIGISKENISRLFRVDSSLSTKGSRDEEGTGLGLILCKEFIERKQGQIGVESEEGKEGKEGKEAGFILPCQKTHPIPKRL
ncbi:MAG: ATP-binding protein [Bacteroidales bacterium]|nr:ATP-binding protein [Bacteroidales bacterium]MCF8351155.1 ATP-binding protein [Bacteroidales bacterium]MCF8375425.1 ATP-binding protein [Bacteroidales bacterium]MCF8400973.1 ATP-binding protein [Bacteroidales bacterium]